jgi:bacterial/archaeal transporter family protein
MALVCPTVAVLWGVWGFLVKLGADRMNPRALQILFVVGMVPPLLLALARVGFVIERDRAGIVYGILNGVLATFGMLAFYAAMARGKASVVAPLTAVFPLFTVIGAVLLLKEKLNRIQVLGIVMAVTAVVIFAR